MTSLPPDSPTKTNNANASSTPHRSTSELSDLTILEFEHPDAPTRHVEHEAHLREIGTADDNPSVPKSTLVVVAETEKLHEDISKDDKMKSGHNLVASLTDYDFAFSKIKATNWSPDSGKFYSDYIKEGLEYKQQDSSKLIMLFEGPSSSTSETSFHNKDKFRFHDWPPPKSTTSKSILGPCKYASTTGSAFPVFLRGGAPPPGLMEHWAEAIPGVADHLPTFVDKVTEEDLVYAYLPVEQIKNHVNDPAVHYHLCGKDAIHLMTQMTTKLLPDTRTSRPCVVKTTHSMGSKGIFIIQNDDDEKEFEQFLEDSGHPTFVVTDFVDIHRNVACHLFIHPDGESVTWFGSNENKRLADGSFSSDSYLYMDDQEKLKRMQLPFVEEVVQCESFMCILELLRTDAGSSLTSLSL